MKGKLTAVLTCILTLVTALSCLVVPAAAGSTPDDWFENWDSYPVLQNMHGVGGWKGWDNDPAATARTVKTYPITSPNSLAVSQNTDLVHEYTGYNSGLWRYTAWQYIPSSFTGQAYFILLNTYTDGGNETSNVWSTQVVSDGSTNTVYDSNYYYEHHAGVLPLIGSSRILILGIYAQRLKVLNLVSFGYQFFPGGYMHLAER